MAWVRPAYSKSMVDKAGRVLVDPSADIEDYIGAFAIVSNWRASHSFPLNTFTVTLKRKGQSIDSNCLVAQRIKRLASIEWKLQRFKGIRLSQLQDIGGCRAVVSNLDMVRELVALYKGSALKHKVKTDDYIDHPQELGYRGIHLIYTYNSDRNSFYNGHKIEMQIRSQFQHAWATAVETVGTFISQALKSSQGEEDWLRFFQLMGTAIAFQEGTAPVPSTPTDPIELRGELTLYAQQLDLINRLEAYGNALRFSETDVYQGQADYYLLVLNPAEQTVQVIGFPKNQLSAAQDEYAKIEKEIASQGGRDAVLVSVDSIASLRRAYPNYFLDTRVFINLVRDVIEGQPMIVTGTGFA